MLPATFLFMLKRLSSSYGIELIDSNYELLLRHRAVLFGLVSMTRFYFSISNHERRTKSRIEQSNESRCHWCRNITFSL